VTSEAKNKTCSDYPLAQSYLPYQENCKVRISLLNNKKWSGGNKEAAPIKKIPPGGRIVKQSIFEHTINNLYTKYIETH
jgi:hypothetical protein